MKRLTALVMAVVCCFALLTHGIAADGWKTKEQMIEDGVSPYRFICLTPEEYTLLAKVVFAEAGSGVEPQENRIGVVQVILNRIISDKFPNTLEGVVSQKGQFACYPYCKNAEPTEACYEAMDAVLMGKDLVIPYEVCFFSTQTQGRQLYARYGGHCFCY